MTDLAIFYRVVQIIGMAAEDSLYAVVIAYPEHPGWWRVVAEFRDRGRADSYAGIENQCCGDMGRIDEAQTEPANAPPEPPSAITLDNFGGRGAGLWAHEADMNLLRAEKAEAEFAEFRVKAQDDLQAAQDQARDSDDQRLAMQARALEAERERDELLARNDLSADWSGVRVSGPVNKPTEAPTGAEPTLKGRAGDVLRAMEQLYNAKGTAVLGYGEITRETSLAGMPYGSVAAALKRLEEQGYVKNELGVRVLLKRADGTAIEPPEQHVDLQSAEAADEPPVVAEPSEKPPTCAWCFKEILPDRKGRFCSNECAKGQLEQDVRDRWRAP